MDKDTLDSFRAIEAIVTPFSELTKRQQDFYKTLLALNTLTLLITIAFLDKILWLPRYLPLILVPFALFAGSLLCSLYVLKIIGDFHANVMTVHITLLGTATAIGAGTAEKKDLEDMMRSLEQPRKELKAIGVKLNKLQGPAIWTYFIGLLTLIAFALINLMSAS